MKYNTISWYDYATDNWGTKWDIQNEYYPYEGGDALYGFGFKTPWGPPWKALLELSRIEQISLFIIFDTESHQRLDPTVMFFKNGEACMIELPFCPNWEDYLLDEEAQRDIYKCNYLNSLAIQNAFSSDKGCNGIYLTQEEVDHVIYELCGNNNTDYVPSDKDKKIIKKQTFKWYKE